MSTPVVTDEMRTEAARLRTQGYGATRVARALGISPSTAARLIYPGLAVQSRKLSREAKRRRRGSCVECGAETRYNGTNVSERCVSCGSALAATLAGRRRGTGPVERRTLAYLQMPGNAGDVARPLAITPNHARNVLHRLVRYGLIVRVSRGVYIAADRHEEAA